MRGARAPRTRASRRRLPLFISDLKFKLKHNAVHLSGEPYDMSWGSMSDGVHIVVSVPKPNGIELEHRILRRGSGRADARARRQAIRGLDFKVQPLPKIPLFRGKMSFEFKSSFLPWWRWAAQRVSRDSVRDAEGWVSCARAR